jgi:hypothetical protein
MLWLGDFGFSGDLVGPNCNVAISHDLVLRQSFLSKQKGATGSAEFQSQLMTDRLSPVLRSSHRWFVPCEPVGDTVYLNVQAMPTVLSQIIINAGTVLEYLENKRTHISQAAYKHKEPIFRPIPGREKSLSTDISTSKSKSFCRHCTTSWIYHFMFFCHSQFCRG